MKKKKCKEGSIISRPYRGVEIQTYRKVHLLAVMIIFAMPWPIMPHPKPTEPYNKPYIQKRTSIANSLSLSVLGVGVTL